MPGITAIRVAASRSRLFNCSITPVERNAIFFPVNALSHPRLEHTPQRFMRVNPPNRLKPLALLAEIFPPCHPNCRFFSPSDYQAGQVDSLSCERRSFAALGHGRHQTS